jgi:hypothetical protein
LQEPGFPVKKTVLFQDTGTVEKAVIPGKIKKTCPHQICPRENGERDEYFSIFTRNPLFSALNRKFPIC